MSSSKIKVLFLSHRCELGGAELRLLELLRDINRSTRESQLLCPKLGKLIKEAEKIGVKSKIILLSDEMLGISKKRFPIITVLKNLLNVMGFMFKLYKFIKEEEFDLIYANSVAAGIYGSIASFLSNTKIVWRVHTILSDQIDKSLTKLIVLLINVIVAKVLCVSSAVKKSFEAYGVNKGKLITIYNGSEFNLEETNYSLREEMGLPRQNLIVGWLGRLTPWKGVEVLLKAAGKIIRLYDSIHFVIVGGVIYEVSQTYYDTLTVLTKQMGMQQRVIFTGYRRDALHLLADFDIFVHTSILPDPAPHVILEAALLGKPIIAANSGGVAEMIEDGREGILVPPNDPDVLAKAIIRLIEAPNERQFLGSAAKQKALEKFSMKQYVESIENILDELAGNQQ